MLRTRRCAALLALGIVLAGCGVPRQTLEIARLQAALPVPPDEPQVRAALQRQADAWAQFADLLQQRELGGIGQVDATFVALVQRTAAVARRQVQIMAQKQDDPAVNRDVLEEFTRRWQQSQRYLEQ